MKMQDEKGCEVYNQIVYENLSRNKALKFLKLHNHTGEAKSIIIDNVQERVTKRTQLGRC